jgi:hypothetical protein
MKRLSFILMFTLCGTLTAQNTFENGVMSELGKWHMIHKQGDNDSLTFALMPTLFSDPATKYEFEKINPRIVTEVFVLVQVDDKMREMTFTEWIQKEVRVLDTTKWDIRFESGEPGDVIIQGVNYPTKIEYIFLENIITGQTRQIFFDYNSDSPDGSVTNLFSITDQRYNK